MSIKLTSVTLSNGSTTVTVNSPSIDLSAIQAGWELQIEGADLFFTIVSGGSNVITIDETFSGTTLTARAAKIIETKAPLTAAVDNVNALGEAMVSTKDDLQAIIDTQGTAASADVTTSTTDVIIDRLLKVNDFGIGDRAVNVGAAYDFDTHYTSGIYLGFGGTHINASLGANPFPDSGSAFSLMASGSGFGSDGQYLQQIAISLSGSPDFKFRAKLTNAIGWSDWEEVYHSGNTNLTQFGDGGNDVQRWGFGLTSTSIVCFIDTNSFAKPTGINVVTPFTIQTLSGAAVATSITPTMTSSSVGQISVTFAGLPGITVDKPYRMLSGKMNLVY
jgi:hypothetical protein